MKTFQYLFLPILVLLSIINGRAVIDLADYEVSVPESEIVRARIINALKFQSDSYDLSSTIEPLADLAQRKVEAASSVDVFVGVDAPAPVAGTPQPSASPQREVPSSEVTLAPVMNSTDMSRAVVPTSIQEDRCAVPVLPTARQVSVDSPPLVDITIDVPVFDFERLLAIQAAVEDSDVYLERVRGKTNVHDLAAYYKELWKRLNTPEILRYPSRESQQFKDVFESTIQELEFVLSHVNTDKILKIGGSNIKLKTKLPYNIQNLRLALSKMRKFGRHAGQSDWDNEVNAHVNAVLVYVWHQVKLDPNLIYTFLSNLIDAAPTCIQGHTVRLLYTIHQCEQNLFQ